MAYQMVATAVTLDDFEGHSPVADVFTCNPSNICAAFYTISTDSVLSWFLCISRASCQQLSQKTAIIFQLTQRVAWFLCNSRASCFMLQIQISAPEVMDPVSYNHSAAVLLTPTRSFLVLGTGMHWRRIHYFSRLLMPSRTTSSLTCHVITSVFSLITFTCRKRGLPSRCAFVFF